MSGFLSGYKPSIKSALKPSGKLKLRKKLNLEEFTDNPPLGNYPLTDDVDEDQINKINEDNNTTDIGLEKSIEAEIDKENVQAADTVIDTVCSRFSEINVNSKNLVKQPTSKSLFSSSSTLEDTIEGSFDTSSRKILGEIATPLSSKKKLSFSSDDKDEGIKEEPLMENHVENLNISNETDEVIEIVDTEDEDELGPPSMRTSDSFINCSLTNSTLNNFFNNPPSIPSKAAVTHSIIERFKTGAQKKPDVQKEVINNSIPIEEDELVEHVELGPTDESDIENDEIVDLTIDDIEVNVPNKDKNNKKSTPKNVTKDTPISVKVSTPSKSTNKKTLKKNVTKINIQLDLKINIKDKTITDDESESDKSEDSDNNDESVKKSHLKALLQSPFIERKTSGETTLSDSPEQQDLETGEKMVVKSDNIDFRTPKKEEKPIIDKDVQSMLTELYGDSWKTPEVMKNFKIKKFREELRKTLNGNNFESFVGSISKDLESTRISSPKTEKPFKKHVSHNNLIKPVIFSSAGKKNAATSEIVPKAVENKTSVPRTPLNLLCDPDTESEESLSDDDEYNPDDTWNASSDEEYVSEKDRIKKRQSVKLEANQMVFTLDDSLNDVLKKYEFQPKPQIEVENPNKTTRRKLFTPAYLNDYEDEEETSQKTPLKSQENVTTPKSKGEKTTTPKSLGKFPTDTGKLFKTPSTNTKIPRASSKTQLTATKSTPCRINDTAAATKDLLKRFSKYSFLKSLDAESNKMLCDDEALYYRENFKTKKNELCEKLFKLYNEKVFDSQLTDVPVKWNKKLQTTGGRCNNSRRANIRKSLIELSDKVLTSADRLRCTLIHEMCHAAAWILNGENGHGTTWKSWTAKANSVFPELPKITVCHRYVIEYRYTYLCINCRARSQAHTKSKKVEEVRCSLCRGEIQLFENKKKTDGTIELVPVQKREPPPFAKYVKLNYNEVKKRYMSNKEAMKILSAQFSSLTVEEKAKL